MDIDFCRKYISSHLPKSFFKPNFKRIFLLGAWLVLALLVILYAKNIENRVALFFLGILLGRLNATLAFFSHEVLHGSVVRSKFMQNFICLISFAPFQVSPTFWRYWHNYLHHTHTQVPVNDPDCYFTHKMYLKSKVVRFFYMLAPGSGSLLSYLYLFYWFSFQALFLQFYGRFKLRIWRKIDNKKVNFELLIQSSMFAIYVFLVKEKALYLILVPYIMQNYILMSYISTNHNLCPLRGEKEQLENSLSLKVTRISDFLDLNFSCHVEHHMFPTLSGEKLKIVKNLTISNFKESYNCLEKHKALICLYKTPRLYSEENVLINPRTAEKFNTAKV